MVLFMYCDVGTIVAGDSFVPKTYQFYIAYIRVLSYNR